jgi:hypothetical protein
MPNFCANDVTIKSDNPVEFHRFLKVSELVNNSVDSAAGLFERLHPQPKTVSNDSKEPGVTESFMNALNGNTEYAYDNWYDWRIANWGTKWDVCNPYFVLILDNVVDLSYETAWSPAEAIWAKVSKDFPDFEITLKYVEEGMDFMGKIVYRGGEVVHQVSLNEIPTEAYLKAGAILDADGCIDWDVPQDYNLFAVIDEFC